MPFCFDISDVGGILLSLSNMVEICTLVWKMKQRLKKKKDQVMNKKFCMNEASVWTVLDKS